MKTGSTRVAVIDLGTNTFHLLVVDIGPDSWHEVARSRVFVNLASAGIDMIGDDAYQRGLDTLTEFNATIKKLAVDNIITMGTAALRTARNAPAFVADVTRQTGIEVNVITGENEAELIASGVGLAMRRAQLAATASDHLLIMDIGGGSVEFVLVQNDMILRKQSFPLGVAVLYGQFHHSEPMSDQEFSSLHSHLDGQIEPFLKDIATLENVRLVGASGTFEVVQQIGKTEAGTGRQGVFHVTSEAFQEFYKEISIKNLEARLADNRIPYSRAKYFVVALFLIKWTLDRLGADEFYISQYAMKEGALAHYF